MDNIDVTACWPPKWRASFEYENSLLADEGEELLTPEEFLQCRYEDWLEATDALRIARAHRHHDVLLKVLEQTTSPAIVKSSGESWARDHIAQCTRIADLAYPPERS